MLNDVRFFWTVGQSKVCPRYNKTASSVTAKKINWCKNFDFLFTQNAGEAWGRVEVPKHRRRAVVARLERGRREESHRCKREARDAGGREGGGRPAEAGETWRDLDWLAVSRSNVQTKCLESSCGFGGDSIGIVLSRLNARKIGAFYFAFSFFYTISVTNVHTCPVKQPLAHGSWSKIAVSNSCTEHLNCLPCVITSSLSNLWHPYMTSSCILFASKRYRYLLIWFSYAESDIISSCKTWKFACCLWVQL